MNNLPERPNFVGATGLSEQLEMDADRKALIEVGILVAGAVDSVDRQAVESGLTQVVEYLKRVHPDFRFEFFQIRRPEMVASGGRVEPSVLLQQAVEQRDARHWDFVFVLTAAELVGNYSPVCFAALSRPLDAAVLSLSLIDPQATGEVLDELQRIEQIAFRMSRLMLHALGHLTGLGTSDRSDDLLFHPSEASDLDRMSMLDDEQINKQRAAFAEIADQRLEEGAGRKLSYPAFVARATWINRREILEAIVAARPWEFPRRLSRLTIASVSTVAILFLTAESWDLALSQNRWQLIGLTLTACVLTTIYVVMRQQLLVRRVQKRSEQTVVTSSSALGIVFVGMLVTWLSLLATGICIGSLLFGAELIADWAASAGLEPEELGFATRLQMSGFSASLGLLIGALGASFESQHYFRHVIFVDEEI